MMFSRGTSENEFSRAIALCKLLAKDQFEAVIVIGGSSLSLCGAQTLLRMPIVPDNIQCHAPHQGQIPRRTIFARTVGIFAKLHIQNSVLAICFLIFVSIAPSSQMLEPPANSGWFTGYITMDPKPSHAFRVKSQQNLMRKQF
jgi:hypothetical protein